MEQSPTEAQVEKKIEVKHFVSVFDFPEAIRQILKGNKVKREGWEQGYAYMDKFLMIENNGTHQWIVSAEDLQAEDWVIL